MSYISGTLTLEGNFSTNVKRFSTVYVSRQHDREFSKGFLECIQTRIKCIIYHGFEYVRKNIDYALLTHVIYDEPSEALPERLSNKLVPLGGFTLVNAAETAPVSEFESPKL